VSRPAAAIPDIVRFGLEDRTDDRIDIEEDLFALSRYFDSEKLLPFLVDAVRRQTEEVHEDLAAALARIGEPAIEPLVELYEQVGEEQGGEILFLLTLLRIKDERIWNLLVEHLQFNAEEGIFLVGIYGGPAAKEALEKLKAESPDLAPEIDPVIENVEAQGENRELPEPIDLWELYPEKLGPVFGVLSEIERLEFLSSPSAELRAEAVASFGELDVSELVAKRLLYAARHDVDAGVRTAAWEALGGAVEHPEINQALLERMNNGSAPLAERCAAMVALASQSDHPAIHERILEFYDIAEARPRAIEAMARTLDPRYASYFLRHFDDHNHEIRHHAIKGIGMAQVSSAANRLPKLFEDEEYRMDALFAYALSVPTTISRGNALALYRKIEEQAGGLSDAEGEVVESALDMRLMRHGLEPVFLDLDMEGEETPEPVTSEKTGRNDPCPCGSGKKFKKCCGA
jgi:HEAT repeat protein